MPMRSRRFLSTLVAVALVLVVACGSDDVPLATVVPATAPAVVAPFVAETFVPATPVPPALFVPPTVESVSDVSATEAGLLGLGQQRIFPAALFTDSERLSRDEVIALWVEFLGDGRVINSQNTNMVDFCSDGSGHVISITTIFGLENMSDQSFSWEVLASVGGRWNEGHLRMTPLDPSIRLPNLTGLPYHGTVLRPPESEAEVGAAAAGVGLTADAFAYLRRLPGILHPDEANALFAFGDEAVTVCHQ